MISEEKSKNRRHKLVLQSQDTNLLMYRYYRRTINFFAKIAKNIIFGRTSSFFDFSEK